MLKTLHQKLKQEQKLLMGKINLFKENKGRALFVIVILVVSALFGWGITNSLVISTGESLNKTLFVKSFSKEIREGDYVTIMSDPDDPIAKGRYLTKKVFCAPGSILKIKGDDYYCNDSFIGAAKHKTKTGEPVTPFNPCMFPSQDKLNLAAKKVDNEGNSYCEIRIPDGYYFVAGTHKDSYDSRYFGLVPFSKILCKTIPII